VGQCRKLRERIEESNTDLQNKEAYKYIYTSLSERDLSNIQCVSRLHASEGNTLTWRYSSLPQSPTYHSGTESIAIPAGPSTLTCHPVDKEVEHAEQSFTTCYDDYCLINRNAKDSACYPQRHSFATHLERLTKDHPRHLEPSLACHANHHRWKKPH
jgi:hypothetical protein